MDDDVSPDQKVLLDASTRFIEQTCPLERVRTRPFRDADWVDGYRRTAGELGWFAMLVPDELGGGSISGEGLVDAALVAYRRGSMLQPGGFVPTNVVAYALARAGSEEQRAKVLSALVAGEQSAAWVGGPSATGVRVADGVLTGTAAVVADADTAAWLLVTAATEAGPAQYLLPVDAPGITVTPLESLDLTRGFAEITFAGTAVTDADAVGDADLVDQQLAVACVLSTAESVGAMDHDFAMALQYAKDRIAFGRPIGSFQAIKHALADTSLLLEMSKAVTLSAAHSVGAADGYGLESASIAKAFVGEHGVDLAQSCFQIFGGIGFTWEHDQHLYLRRLTSDAGLYGDPDWHRERLCVLGGI